MRRTKEDKVVEELNFSALREEHINKWVALTADYKKVVAIGDSLKAVLDEAHQKDAVIMQVLPRLGYAPSSQ